LLMESLNSDQNESESDVDINLCYDKNLVISISSCYLSISSQIINIHLKFDYCLQRKQSLVEKQLAVVLYRLDEKALKDLKKNVIIWSHDNYQQKIHKGFENMHRFPNIISALDSSHMNLLEASRIFINYDLGYLASVHDAKILVIARAKNKKYQNETDLIEMLLILYNLLERNEDK
ncbi:21557_t:CDS:2, partial [Cetraspora pellucida]